MSWRGFVAVLAVLFAVYSGLAGRLPVYDDELYYWCWSKDLQLSYYDHPPLTAVMIRASTAVFGDTLFAVRFPACVATVAVLAVVGRLTRPRGVLFGTVLTPLFTFGGVVMTPDVPLLLFWSLYLAWLVNVHRRLTPEDGSPSNGVPGWLWASGGALLGGGMLGKYTAGLAVPAGALTFALLGWPAVKRCGPGYLLHLGVAFVVALPILLYNLRAGFAPLAYQWQHAAAGGDGEGGLKPLGEFVGVQVLLTGTLPLVLLPWVGWRLPTLLADPRLRVCVCLYAVPLLFFLGKSAAGPIEGNWALASYLAFWPLAARWFAGLDALSWKWRLVWRWLGRLSFFAPAVSVAALGAHLVHPLPVFAPGHDRLTRQYAREELACDIADYLAHRADMLPVFTESYQWTALLRFHGVDIHQEEGIHRPSQFTQVPERMNDHPAAYYLSTDPFPPAFADHLVGFGPPQLVTEFPLRVRGEWYETHKLWLYRKAAPRPTPATPPGPPAAH